LLAAQHDPRLSALSLHVALPISVTQTDLVESLRLAIHERLNAELLREATQLSKRGSPLVEIDEMRLDPPLGELRRFAQKFGVQEIGSAHVCTPATIRSRMPSSAW